MRANTTPPPESSSPPAYGFCGCPQCALAFRANIGPAERELRGALKRLLARNEHAAAMVVANALTEVRRIHLGSAA